MEKKKEVFVYTYSAKEQEEIRKIRESYAPQMENENKLERLRQLDASATKPGSIAALVVGVISVLLLGIGMCCCMVWGGNWFFPGIVVGVFGIVGMALAYPLYDHITKKKRDRLAPEIMRLSDELMQK